MAMSINFGTTFIEPRTSIRILGLHIDGKLKWEPHVTQLKSKMINQGNALKCLAGSTWGGHTPQGPNSVQHGRAADAYVAAPIWHNPQGTFEKIRKRLQRGRGRRRVLQVQPWAEVGTGQSLANIQTRMSDWWFNKLSNGWRQY